MKLRTRVRVRRWRPRARTARSTPVCRRHIRLPRLRRQAAEEGQRGISPPPPAAAAAAVAGGAKNSGVRRPLLPANAEMRFDTVKRRLLLAVPAGEEFGVYFGPFGGVGGGRGAAAPAPSGPSSYASSPSTAAASQIVGPAFEGRSMAQQVDLLSRCKGSF